MGKASLPILTRFSSSGKRIRPAWSAAIQRMARHFRENASNTEALLNSSPIFVPLIPYLPMKTAMVLSLSTASLWLSRSTVSGRMPSFVSAARYHFFPLGRAGRAKPCSSQCML